MPKPCFLYAMRMTTHDQTLIIPISHAGKRLDKALAELFPEYSRSRLSQWLQDGHIIVDGASPSAKTKVLGGEQVVLTVPNIEETAAVAQNIPLHVVHEDAHLLVINKPSGLVVHPGAGNPDGTLVNALLHYDERLSALPRAGIVHRLDKDTTGALLIARDLPTHTALVRLLKDRDISRAYQAVVTGYMIAGGTVDAALGRHPVDRIRFAVRDDDDPHAKHAVTHYRVGERFQHHTLVDLLLETGRTHQIRVHMAHIGYPLIGDQMYGRRLMLPKGASDALIEALRGFKRQALHAKKLTFVHPVTEQTIEAEAEPPADFQALLDVLRAESAAA